MGISASDSFTQNTVNSLTSVVSKTITTVLQDVELECTGVNIFKANIGTYASSISNGTTTFANCNPPANIGFVNITQNANPTCSIKGDLTNDINIKITNELKTNVNNWLSANSKANNGWLGIGIAIAANQQISQTDLANNIATTISTKLSQTCKAILNASNTGEISVCGNIPNGITIYQNAVTTNLTSCIINNVITSVQNNAVLNGIVTKIQSQVSAGNEGIWGGLRWIVIAVIAVAVIGVIGTLLFLIFGGKKDKDKDKPGAPGSDLKQEILRIQESNASPSTKIRLESQAIQSSSLPSGEKQELLNRL